MKTNAELYKVSKRVYKESLLHAQLLSLGGSQAKFLEKLDKDKNLAGAQSVILKIMVALYLVVLTLAPVRSFMTINAINGISGYDTIWSTFAGALSISGFLLFQPVVLLVFSIMFAWGLMSGGAYKWLHTLPFGRKDIEKIGLFSFFRGMNLQLIMMALVLPVGSAIGVSLTTSGAGISSSGIGFARTIAIVLVSLVISYIGALFNLSLIVIIGRKMALVMEEHDVNNRKANIIRVVFLVLYLSASMLTMYTIQIAIEYIPLLYDPSNQFMSIGTTNTVNAILSFIPFPLAGGYLLTSLAIGITKIPIIVVIGSIVGILLYAGLTYLLYSKALSTLRNITSIERKHFAKKETDLAEVKIEIESSTPVRAFVKRDLAVITRDMQAIMYLIMPIMIPIFAVMSKPESDGGIAGTPMGVPVIIMMFYVVMTSYMLVIGLTNIESGGETITSSLPISTRDQIISKIPYFFGTIPLAICISMLFWIGTEGFYSLLFLMLALLPAIPLIGIAGFFFKILLFGKLRYKFVIEEVRNEFKIAKYIGGFIFMAVLMAVFIIAAIVGYWAIFVAEGVLALLVFGAFLIMFPKQKKLQ